MVPVVHEANVALIIAPAAFASLSYLTLLAIVFTGFTVPWFMSGSCPAFFGVR